MSNYKYTTIPEIRPGAGQIHTYAKVKHVKKVRTKIYKAIS